MGAGPWAARSAAAYLAVMASMASDGTEMARMGNKAGARNLKILAPRVRVRGGVGLPETKRTTTPEAGDYMFPAFTARPARRDYDTRRPREREKATTHYYVRKFDPSSARAVSSPGVARLLSFAPSAVPRNAQPSEVSSNRTTPSQASSFAQ